MAGKQGYHVSWAKPDFSVTTKSHRNYTANYRAAMMYAHYELSSAYLKKEVIKYLKSLDPKHPMLGRIEDIHENRFATVGKYMYILNHGGDIPDEVIPRLMPVLEEIVCEEEAKNKEKEISKSPNDNKVKGISQGIKSGLSIQDRLREKAADVSEEVEGWIESFANTGKVTVKTVEDFVNLFKINELKAPHMRHMQSFFKYSSEEVAEALDTKDKDLIEGYSHYTKPELKRLDLFYKNLMKACEMMQEVAKVERAPRKKKPVSQEKLISKLKYKKDDNTLGIVSISPANIIGAKELWTFNTKTRKISRFIADDMLGPLSVKGASIVGYNEAKSISKTLRKPSEQLTEFKKAGKVQLRTFLDNIKAVDIKANGRMNEDTVLLKVF